MRFCLDCRDKHGVAPVDCYFYMDEMGHAECPRCHTVHDGKWGNLTAPRAFRRFMLLAGRGGGKTLIGAHAVREELMIPGAMWWALGATYKLLHDSTLPTLVGLLHPQWIKRWDPEHMEITLKNGSMVAFRSLEDPDRARGPHGIGGYWFDEAAKCPERAWHVAAPMLIRAGGIAIATTTPLGYDWTYDNLEKHALVYKTPGYWTAKWWSEHNPLFATNPVMKEEIDTQRRIMPPELFAQEYQAERTNAQGLVYGPLVHQNVLVDDDAVRRYMPEWQGHLGSIDPSRPIIVGLDSGSDHPFGAVMIVVTPKGLVVIADYLVRMKAPSLHHNEIGFKFCLSRFTNITFAANKNEAALKLEWALKGTGVAGVENKHEVGIPRTYGWLATKQLKFAYTVSQTIEQMGSYRYADNTKASTGEKTDKEKVFKLKDELPDAVRYAIVLHPDLPDMKVAEMTDEQQARWDAFSEKTRREITQRRDARKKDAGHIEPGSKDYPLGDFYQHNTESSWGESPGAGLDKWDDMNTLMGQ